jgi:dTDP-4-amino-4,6-dideoxygalactose transaminase
MKSVRVRRALLAIIDGLIIYASYFAAIHLRFTGQLNDRITGKFLENLQSIILLYAIIGVIFLFIAGFYRKSSAQANIIELVSIIIAVTVSSILHFVLPYLFIDFTGYFLPRSVLAIAYCIQIILIGGIRLAWRIITDKELKKRILRIKYKNIPFSPPDITDAEIDEVIKAMKSGWITTGPRTKLFEQNIADYIGTKKAVCLNSATASMELVLRILGVGPGDEVITSAYTYTASASVVDHVGANIVLVDVAPDSYEMDYSKLADAITEKTKVIIPVDIAGRMCDYDSIYRVVESKKHLFKADNEIQKLFNRVVVMADAAHAFGAVRKGKKCGLVADFTCFSFHAVKNLTTAEGGAVVWRNDLGLDDEWLYEQFMLYSLHGQSKDALAKTKKGAWEYDIVHLGYKCNMTDILASFGLMQLKRYNWLLNRRKEIIEMYDRMLLPLGIERLQHYGEDFASTGHLYLTRIPGVGETERNAIIANMAELGVACNVHYKPLPMFTAYKNLGFDIKDYPNAFDMYRNEITLPLHTLLTDEDVKYVCICLEKAINEVLGMEHVEAEAAAAKLG